MIHLELISDVRTKPLKLQHLLEDAFNKQAKIQS